MASTEWTLARLLAPVAVTHFFDEVWEQQPLYVGRGSPGYYDDLLNQDDVQRWIETGDLRYSELRLSHRGEILPSEDYVGEDGLVDAARVDAAYQAGSSIVLPFLQRSWPPLLRLCQQLEQTLHRPAQTNIYVTPPGAQGLPRHYDTHDVFVLQVAGQKRWCLYNAPFPLPLTQHPHGLIQPTEVRLQEERTVRAGDLLYLPRGVLHEARTEETLSIHVALGVHTYSWADLFARTLERLSEAVPALRRSVPLGGPFQPDETGESDLAALLERFADEVRQDAREHVGSGRLAAPRPTHAPPPVVLERVTGTSRLRRRPGLSARIRTQGNRVALLFRDQQIQGPAAIEPALRFMLAAESFTLAEVPGGLSMKSKLVLAHRLLRVGVLTVVDYGEA